MKSNNRFVMLDKQLISCGLCSNCSIMNSLIIVLFLSGMIGMILLRTLHRDIARYNQLTDSGVRIFCYMKYLTQCCFAKFLVFFSYLLFSVLTLSIYVSVYFLSAVSS